MEPGPATMIAVSERIEPSDSGERTTVLPSLICLVVAALRVSIDDGSRLAQRRESHDDGD